MCMMVYIGSGNELPIIEYQNNISVIYTRQLNVANSDDMFANENLTKQYRYYIGSWQGCGCGFQFAKGCQGFSDEDNVRGEQSVKALFEYIQAYVTDSSCELLSFWSGEDISEPDCVIDLRNFILGDSFKFLEGQYIVVKK